MDRLDPGTVIAGDPEVVGCTLGDGSALLNLRTNIYYSLNEVGSFVWDAVGEPLPFAQLVDRVCREFDAPRDLVEADVAQLVRKLGEAGLVQCTRQ